MASNDTERSSGDVGLRLTYAEIAARLGISGDAARQLVRRRGWLRIVPNRRGATTTVIVPEAELAGEHWRDTRSADGRGTTPDGNRTELRTALTLVDRLSVQLAEANARTDAALQRAADADARADRAETTFAAERQRADDLRAQIDVLNAELVATGAEADRTMADERMRADRLNERVDALSADLTRAETDRRVAEVRADKAETAIAAEHARADALRTAIDELKAGQTLMVDIHARDLAIAQHDALAAQQAAAELRQTEATRKARGLVARLRSAWRGE